MAPSLPLYQNGHKCLRTRVKHGTYVYLVQAPTYLIKPSALQSFEKSAAYTAMSHQL